MVDRPGTCRVTPSGPGRSARGGAYGGEAPRGSVDPGLGQGGRGGREPVRVDVHRRGEVEALAEVAADLAQHVELSAGLDALGDDLEADSLRQPDDQAHERGIVVAEGQALDE